MSINPTTPGNQAALLALNDLANTQNELNRTQSIVSSQLAISEPQDNPALWSIAQGQQQQVTALDSVTASLNRATSLSDVATAAGQTVLNLLNQLKQDALSATSTSLDTTSRQAYASDFQSVMGRIASTVNSAGFDGANLLDGSSTGNQNVLGSADGSVMFTLTGTDLSLGGSVITLSSTYSLGTASAATAALSAINSSLSNVTTAMAGLGTQSSQLSAHATFIGTLSDSLQTSVGDLINADMGAESAKLQALQVQQQLGVQSVSIANQAPSVILSLFR
jgi:flagellin